MQLIDIGANLTHASFESDLEQVLTEARSAHVAHIMVTGTDIASSEAAQELCARYPGLPLLHCRLSSSCCQRL